MSLLKKQGEGFRRGNDEKAFACADYRLIRTGVRIFVMEDA